jgi:hypothetical protein
MYYILERGGEKIMKKRWFVVILTIGLLLHVLPLSVLALSPDPITDADDWSDLSTVSDSLDDLQEQEPPVPDLLETGSEKSLASNEATADDRPTVNLTPKTLDKGSGDEESDDKESGDEESDDKESGDEESDDEESDDDDPADAGSDKAAADGPSAAKPTPQPLDKGSGDDDPADDDGSTTTQAECKIGDTPYSTLDEAISMAIPGDRIDLLRDIKRDEGLTFDNKTLTISGGDTYTLTLKELGMYATNGSDITFKDLTLIINAHTNPSGAGATANLIYSSKLRLSHVEFTLTPDILYGSGICLYNGSDLYFEDNTNAVIDGFSADSCSGIYADTDTYSEDEIHEVRVSSSTLTVTDSGWNGMTINPVNLNLTNSHVTLNNNGKGGLGCYYGKLKMENSTLDANNNGGKGGIEFGTRGSFVDELDMDRTSVLNANNNNGIAGLLIGDGGVIRSGAKLNCNNNAYIGLYVFTDGNWLGDVVIEHGATVTACGNAYSGVHNSYKLKIEGTVIADSNKVCGITNDAGDKLIITSTADVSVCQNTLFGIFNYARANLTVESGATLKVEENTGSGIANGPKATLNLGAGIVQRNNALYKITFTFYPEGAVDFTAQGGGIQNLGTAILSDDVELYNNHARLSGDDIYNADGATITFGDTGKGWALDGDPDCYDFIDGWYDDYETTRWNAHGDEADLHMVLVAPVNSYTGPLSLKAAHGSTGSLTVCKETVGELLPSDYDTVFTFELTLDDDAITTIDDKWCGVPFKNGKTSFTLKSGESITLSNLPAGMGYTITETAQDGWTLLNLNPAETGVVPQNDTAKVVFTNLKNSPDDPYVPVVPVDPETPEEPEGPETPETPEEPEEPEIPEETEETEAPGELPAEEPAQTDTSASLAQPEETPTQNTTTVTLIQTGTTDWLAAVLLIFGIGLLVCGWFFDRKQRAAKH